MTRNYWKTKVFLLLTLIKMNNYSYNLVGFLIGKYV